MYINFNSISIVGFGSISKATVEFSKQGIVLVKGINNYEKNSSSNGSGKSTCFDSLFWCIYGKTPSGINDPTNRYQDGGCYVKLAFNIDETDYVIIRTIKYGKMGSTLILSKNGEDISGRNKTDTERIIKEDIIGMNSDIFLSTTYLNQGFASRISALAPSGRKERIEVLTGTEQQVESFKDKVSAKKTQISDELDKVNRDISFKRGDLQRLTSQITQLESEIVKADDNKPEGDVETVRTKIGKFNEMITNLDKAIQESTTEYQNINSKYNDLVHKLNSKKSELSKLDKNIHSITDSGVCPTCGQSLAGIDHEALLVQYRLEFQTLMDEIATIEPQIQNTMVRIKDINNNIETLRGKKTSANNQVNMQRSLLESLLSVRDTTEDKNKIVSMKAEARDIEQSISTLASTAGDLEHKLSVANHCIQLITKKFRGYLLTNIIDFINVRLEEYSHMLFSNESDIVRLVIDAAKLDIYLGDALYDSLSGGEKRKVDMALVLAQRDLALGIAGNTCNILILDEVMDNLDEVATNSVLHVIDIVASTVDSIFIISHNNYDIAYDKIMTVTKNEDRVSYVEIM